MLASDGVGCEPASAWTRGWRSGGASGAGSRSRRETRPGAARGCDGSTGSGRRRGVCEVTARGAAARAAQARLGTRDAATGGGFARSGVAIGAAILVERLSAADSSPAAARLGAAACAPAQARRAAHSPARRARCSARRRHRSGRRSSADVRRCRGGPARDGGARRPAAASITARRGWRPRCAAAPTRSRRSGAPPRPGRRETEEDANKSIDERRRRSVRSEVPIRRRASQSVVCSSAGATGASGAESGGGPTPRRQQLQVVNTKLRCPPRRPKPRLNNVSFG